MSELKEIYVIEWMGPYNSIDEIIDRKGTEECCIYMITGQRYYNGPKGIRYVGITKRFVGNRLTDKDHLEKQEKIIGKQFWAGRFSVSSYNNLDIDARRKRAERVEALIARYLKHICRLKFINEKKTCSDPKKPICIVNRWQRKKTEENRYNKP